MTPRERIMAEAHLLRVRSEKKSGDNWVDFDEETNLVTVYVNGSPRYTMHVSVYEKMKAELE